MANKVCTVLVIALAMFGTGALAKPGYAAGYAVDYYVSVKKNWCLRYMCGLRQL